MFSRRAYAWPGLDRVEIVPPSIDAFSPKNQDLDRTAVDAILSAAGIQDGRPAASPEFVRRDGTRASVERKARLLEEEPLSASAPLVVQVSRILVHALVARALGLRIELTYFFLFVPLLAVIVSLPISFNGIGVREGAGVVLFGLVGVSRAHAFSLQFTTYLVGVAVSLLGGVTFLARLPLRRAGARPMEGSS